MAVETQDAKPRWKAMLHKPGVKFRPSADGVSMLLTVSGYMVNCEELGSCFKATVTPAPIVTDDGFFQPTPVGVVLHGLACAAYRSNPSVTGTVLCKSVIRLNEEATLAAFDCRHLIVQLHEVFQVLAGANLLPAGTQIEE